MLNELRKSPNPNPIPKEAPLELIKSLTISTKDRGSEFLVHKVGTVMGNIEKRHAKLKQTCIIQIKHKGSDESVKNLGRPSLVTLESP